MMLIAIEDALFRRLTSDHRLIVTLNLGNSPAANVTDSKSDEYDQIEDPLVWPLINLLSEFDNRHKDNRGAW
jgi:hypothetical protein